MRIADLDEKWLARALGLDPGAVHDVRHAPLGTGQVADTYRVEFTVDGEGERRVVLKVTSADETSLRTGVAEQSYLREVRFYQQLAPALGVRVPICRHAEISSDGTDFALLMEDLSAYRAGDQLTGCTPEEAAVVLSEAAGLHAPRWADPALRDLAWLPGGRGTRPAAAVAAMSAAFPVFCRRYADLLDPDTIAVGRRLFDHLPEYFARQAEGPDTVQHGDFRPDNLLFAPEPGIVAVVDWQTVARGPGLLDVSYFLGTALPADQRRSTEHDLVRHYHDELCRRGVTGYRLADCLRDYTKYAFQGYFIGALAAMAVKRTERGDRMFTTMVRRSAAQVLELGAQLG
ncbi:phosphotransferase family protein [Nocardia sp. alder85J]|uniref:phosphotransferase family protein n=1 Tax=Nocardia sp. alder85J TaxID=2862949 RepID=UPI001CD6A556|nr:phosphotransferase [Nocardia sp. alder85J]MCX4096819.1 phosphotransferase [Nocardia sp. alder85J]